MMWDDTDILEDLPIVEAIAFRSTDERLPRCPSALAHITDATREANESNDAHNAMERSCRKNRRK